MDDEGDGPSQPTPTPESNGIVVLAQPVANPSPSASNTPAVIVNVEDQQADGNPADAPAP